MVSVTFCVLCQSVLNEQFVEDRTSTFYVISQGNLWRLCWSSSGWDPLTQNKHHIKTVLQYKSKHKNTKRKERLDESELQYLREAIGTH